MTKALHFMLANDGPGDYIRIGGSVRAKNGGLEIRLNHHGNHSEERGPVVYLVSQDGKVRVVVFGNINSEEPTHIVNLDGAFEKKRKS